MRWAPPLGLYLEGPKCAVWMANFNTAYTRGESKKNSTPLKAHEISLPGMGAFPETKKIKAVGGGFCLRKLMR